MKRADGASSRSIHKSLREYGRGIVGGLLFSLPLLYTMEVWWAGFTLHPGRQLAYVVVTFFLLLGYNRYAGLRRDASRTEVAIDSIEEMGLGLLVAAAVLWLLGRITGDMSLGEIIGKIVVEAMTVAIGVSVGTAQLGGDGDEEDTGSDEDPAEVDFGGQLVIAFCGAVLFAANVAPTEEIQMIAASTHSVKIVGLALVSILLGGFILHYSEFHGAEELVHADSTFSVVRGAVIAYAVALAASAMILWFFGRFDGVGLVMSLSQVVVLGLAATLGASAGRLLLQ